MPPPGSVLQRGQKTTHGRSSKKPTVGRRCDLPWVVETTYSRSLKHALDRGLPLRYEREFYYICASKMRGAPLDGEFAPSIGAGLGSVA